MEGVRCSQLCRKYGMQIRQWCHLATTMCHMVTYIILRYKTSYIGIWNVGLHRPSKSVREKHCTLTHWWCPKSEKPFESRRRFTRMPLGLISVIFWVFSFTQQGDEAAANLPFCGCRTLISPAAFQVRLKSHRIKRRRGTPARQHVASAFSLASSCTYFWFGRLGPALSVAWKHCCEAADGSHFSLKSPNKRH